jgi:hypothetical protein
LVVCFVPLLGSGTPFRNGLNLFFAFNNLTGDIKTAETGAVVVEVRIPIITGANNIQVDFFLTFRKSARACPISITFFIDQETFD